MKKDFWIDVLLATLLIFFLMWGILRITQLNFFNAFDSIGKALSDVDLTDYVFWGLREDPGADESVVIVNIGNLSRREIAEQISIISKYEPRVIGLDMFFDCPGGRDTVSCPQLKDVFGNEMLSYVIRDAGNVVLATKLEQTDSLAATNPGEVFDSLKRSDSMFRDYAVAEGFANLDTDAAFQDDVKTCRSFNPQMPLLDGRMHRAFAVELAMQYDSIATARFLKRDNFTEYINFRGNVFDRFEQNNPRYRNVFYVLDVDDVLRENFTPETIKDKIVIFGYLGSELGDPSWTDRFYTPLNQTLAGKANPDMFGVVVHANIVSMILHGEYINSMPEWGEITMAFLFCLLNVAFFLRIMHRMPDWYDGITKLIQVVEIFLLTVVMVLAFYWFNLKMDMAITLAVIALAGDTLEVYAGVVKNGFIRLKRRYAMARRPV
ncbi:MAG TPA: CHASE2 domain-containing protein [Cyclobacteriaceae bacterium]